MKLKKCPFCGNKKIYLSGSDNVCGHPYWYVYCDECGANTVGSSDRDVAIEAWNRRPNQQHD